VAYVPIVERIDRDNAASVRQCLQQFLPAEIGSAFFSLVFGNSCILLQWQQ
jgi:hypothetical protein